MTDQAQHQLATLEISSLSKAFGRRVICRDATLILAAGESLAVVGPNGSGKSTFIKMLAGLLRPDAGTIHQRVSGAVVKPEEWYRHVGLVSPELALYEELTAIENLRFASTVGGWGKGSADFEALLDEFGLSGRGDDRVGAYSSGMKQRLKFVAALLKDPSLLLLDEPTSNLDEEGCERVWRALARRTTTLVLATNVPAEADRIARKFLMGPGGGMVADG
ncbi:MAG TPA: ABC transporter ATP-binding protein [Acidobacteriota bacterium]|nr:ABC transporter ATP-binding protein [Acidobacteriota bacterium]